ncbi:MAG: hypothetical protein J6U21_06135, partial [Bacteroidales bacterium]|nr:hypothetical protein [Bacteroidales bacterium]
MGTSTGVTTNVDGKFSIERIAGKKLLAISFLGFETD